MAIPTNFNLSVDVGETHISCGDTEMDIGILLIGDSNMCGAGGGVDAALDATVRPIFYIEPNGNIIAVDTSSNPYLNHTLNDGLNEVGPDLKFCDRFAQEKTTGKRSRVVGIPCGDWASGFSTGQWEDGQSLYELMQSLTNTLLAQNEFNTLGAIFVMLGTNDTGDFSPDTLWRDTANNFITELRTTAFTGNGAMNSFAKVPLAWAGVPQEWMGSVSSRLAIQAYIEDFPNNHTYVGFASTTGIAGESGDIIHYTGAGNRTLGYDRAWQAILDAEINV